MFTLKDKTVLVAGGAGYLGTPVCLQLRRMGANVCIADRDAAALDRAVATVSEAEGAGGVTGHALDMADEDSILACADAAAEAFGGLWGLVVATAGATAKTFDELTAEDFDRANRINLTGDFLLSGRHRGT